MRVLGFALASGAMALSSMFGCGSSSSGGNTPDPFVGSWNCQQQITLTFTKPSGAPQYNSTESDLVTVADNGDGTVTTTGHPDSGSGCATKFTVSGNNATIVSGQTCTPSGGLTISYTSGSATVNGSSLTANEAFTFSGTLTVTSDGGSQQVSAEGSGTAAYSCTKE